MALPDDETVKKMHRYFAVEANNRGWDLAEKAGQLSDNERDELLDCAHAAAMHWIAIGDPIHRARADMLLALAHGIAGEALSAGRYAQRCNTFCESDDKDITNWDRAFSLLLLAFTSGVAGDQDASERFMAEARKAGESVEEEDRGHFAAEVEKIVARLSKK